CEQQPLCADITCLTPPAMHPQRRGVLGKFRFLAALYAITPGRPTERLHSRIEQSIAGLNNVFAGGGKLPFNSGLFVKILADSPLAIRSATLVIFNTIRCELLGAPAPAVRK